MKRLLVFTAFERPEYLRETLETWRNVRGFYSWPIVVSIEPSEIQNEIREIFEELNHPNIVIRQHTTKLGVLEHPFWLFDTYFAAYDFIVRAEDDLLVSDDILEYFEWASTKFENQENVAAVIGHTFTGGPADEVNLRATFSPWVWGTWKVRWQSLIGPTWDHDYSTYNGSPGHQSGWDWNLNTRIYPEHDLLSVIPVASRVQNIGVYGTHAQPIDFPSTLTASFAEHREPKTYRLTDSR